MTETKTNAQADIYRYRVPVIIIITLCPALDPEHLHPPSPPSPPPSSITDRCVPSTTSISCGRWLTTFRITRSAYPHRLRPQPAHAPPTIGQAPPRSEADLRRAEDRRPDRYWRPSAWTNTPTGTSA